MFSPLSNLVGSPGDWSQSLPSAQFISQVDASIASGPFAGSAWLTGSASIAATQSGAFPNSKVFTPPASNQPGSSAAQLTSAAGGGAQIGSLHLGPSDSSSFYSVRPDSCVGKTAALRISALIWIGGGGSPAWTASGAQNVRAPPPRQPTADDAQGDDPPRPASAACGGSA